ncbi:MAG TPA: hypothetical protein VGC41_02260, partial [Kofleriaceae bacterium]
EVMSYLQREPRLRAMKTVVVSGEASPQVPKKFGYMRKPFRLDALLEMLEATAAGPPQSS